MKEVWKPIPNYENLYEISNLGRIKGLKRNLILSQGTLFGYNICSLCKNGVGTTFRVHRLVAMLFCPDYFDGCEVHHKDENRQNNRVDNLVCMTKLEHLQEHGNGMKMIKKVDKFGNETTYVGVRFAAKENGISHQSIMAALKGKRPTAVGCKWYYVN